MLAAAALAQIPELLAQFSFPVSLVVLNRDGIQAGWGEPEREYPWASVTKLATSYFILQRVAARQVELTDPVGPAGAVLADLLGHTSGYDFAGGKIVAPVGQKRIYSNFGFEVAAEYVCGTQTDFAAALTREFLTPARIGAQLQGSPAYGMRGSIQALAALAAELLAPTLLPESLWQLALQPYRPGLAGVLPGYGYQKDNQWGLGMELRANKHPHWTAANASPTTYGHFGVSGSFIWVDPQRQLAAGFLSAEKFGAEQKALWPQLNELILTAFTE